MGYQNTQLLACTGHRVLGLHLRVHRFAQRTALHLESDPSPHSHRDDVVDRFLD